MLSRLPFLAALSALVVLSACGRSPTPVYPVQGKVTYNGEVLTTGSVSFIPVAGGPPAEGHIQPDGSYILTTFKKGDGAVPGEHQVMVSAYQDNGPNANSTPLIPPKFSSGKSGVSGFVKEEKSNTVDLALEGPVMKKEKPVEMP